MNLQYLFEIQAGLVEHIEEKHPELKGQNNLDWKILALQVELGECANEWRGFKKWSKNQNPKGIIHTTSGATPENAAYFKCMNDECGQYLEHEDFKSIFVDPDYEECPRCEVGYVYPFRARNPLLEKYVDCLHFILSIGLELKVNVDSLKEYCSPKKMLNLTDHFLWTNKKLLELYENIRDRKSSNAGMLYLNLFNSLIGLGEMLGFTWEQIEQAYLEKNKMNHERQVNGY